MVNSMRFLYIATKVVVLAALLTSCGRRKSLPDTRMYKLTQLHRLLTSGAPELVVTQAFGMPIVSEILKADERLLTFHSLAPPSRFITSNDVIGFQVLIRSNVVVDWTPVRTPNDKFE